MGKFLTDLVVEKVTEQDNFSATATWRTMAPLVFESDVLGEWVTVPAGFETDFASVPRLPLTYLLAGDTGHNAAVVHDYLCRSKMVERAVADKVFREALAAEGVPAWRKTLMYLGVRIGSLMGIGT